jgi:hypothetical protein
MSHFITLLTLPFFAAGHTHHAKTETPADSARMTLVVVQNDRPTPVTIYADEASGEYRIGTVPAWEMETLRVPDALVLDESNIDFYIAPRGDLDLESGYLEVHRGEHVGLIVPPR